MGHGVPSNGFFIAVNNSPPHIHTIDHVHNTNTNTTNSHFSPPRRRSPKGEIARTPKYKSEGPRAVVEHDNKGVTTSAKVTCECKSPCKSLRELTLRRQARWRCHLIGRNPSLTALRLEMRSACFGLRSTRSTSCRGPVKLVGGQSGRGPVKPPPPPLPPP